MGQSCVRVGRGAVCTPVAIAEDWQAKLKNDYTTSWRSVPEARYELIRLGDHL
jgi:hypothetical protein